VRCQEQEEDDAATVLLREQEFLVRCQEQESCSILVERTRESKRFLVRCQEVLGEMPRTRKLQNSC
jgi:hypothetical protein